jgi:hypothetical protein
MTDDTQVPHKTLPITAPTVYWRALGYTIYQGGSGQQYADGHYDGILILAMAATDGSGPAVIASALAERTRRQEEHERNAAVTKLADAILQSSRQEALESIIGSLTEKTQFAVRAQLRERGVVLT